MDDWEYAYGIGGGFSTGPAQPQPGYTPPSTYQPQTLISNPYTTGPRPSTQGLQIAPTGVGGSWQSAPNYIPQMTNFMSEYRAGGTSGAASGGEFYGEPEGMGRETQIDMGYSGYSNPTQRYGMPAGTNQPTNPYGLLGPGPTNPYGGLVTRPTNPYGSVGGAIGPLPGAAPAPAPPVTTGYTPPTTGVQMPAPSNPYGNLSGGPRPSTPAPAPSNPYGDLSGAPSAGSYASRYGSVGGAVGPAPGRAPTPAAPVTTGYQAPTRGVQMPASSNPYGDLSGTPGNPYGSIGSGPSNPYGSVGGAVGPAPGQAPTTPAPVTTGYSAPPSRYQSGDPYGVGGFNPDAISDGIDSDNASQHNWSWDGQDGALTPRTPADQFGGQYNPATAYAPAGTGGSMPSPYGGLPRTITNQTTSPYVGQTSKFTNSVPQTGGYQSYGAPGAQSQSQAYTSRYGGASPPGLLGGGATLP